VTIESALAEIKKETGLIGFFVVGGPEPRCNGDIMVMSYVVSLGGLERLLTALRAHTGKASDGLDFGESYDGWKSNVEEPFVTYLNDIFRKNATMLFHTCLLTICQPVKFALTAPYLKGQGEIHLHRRLPRAAACLPAALLAQPLQKKQQRKSTTVHMGLEA